MLIAVHSVSVTTGSYFNIPAQYSVEIQTKIVRLMTDHSNVNSENPPRAIMPTYPLELCRRVGFTAYASLVPV